jgi:hypothetical protein
MLKISIMIYDEMSLFKGKAIGAKAILYVTLRSGIIRINRKLV